MPTTLRRRAPRLGALIAVPLLAAGLASCGGDQTQESATPPPLPTETTEAPRPSAPPRPKTLGPDAAAVAFVENFFDRLNFAIATGETDVITEVSTKSCESCAALVRNIREVYDGGGYIEGGRWRASGLRTTEVVADGVIMAARIVLMEQRIHSDNALKVVDKKAFNVALNLQLRDRWKLRILDVSS